MMEPSAAIRSLTPIAEGCKRLELFYEEVVQAGAGLAADCQDVFEARGGDECDASAAAFE